MNPIDSYKRWNSLKDFYSRSQLNEIASVIVEGAELELFNQGVTFDKDKKQYQKGMQLKACSALNELYRKTINKFKQGKDLDLFLLAFLRELEGSYLKLF